MDINHLRQHLPEELFTQLAGILQNVEGLQIIPTNDGNWLPRSRLNELMGEKDTAIGTLNTRINELAAQLATAQAAGGNAQTLQGTIEQLRNDLAARDSRITELQLRSDVLADLRKAGFRDPDMAIRLLDMTKVTRGDDGKLSGLTEQTDQLRESAPYLLVDSGQHGQRGGYGGSFRETGKDTSGHVPNTSEAERNAPMNEAIRAAFGRSTATGEP